MSNITLELREQDSDRNYGNGDWETNIEPQTIYEGDEIVMRNVFIDTEATSNEKINIPEDLKINLEFIYYFNFYLPKDGDANFFKDGANVNPLQPNGFTQVQYKATFTGVGSKGVRVIDHVFFSFNLGAPVGQTCASTDFTMFYKDPNNQPQSIRLHLNAYKNTGGAIFPSSQRVNLPHAILFLDDGTPTQGISFSPSTADFEKPPFNQSLNYVGTGLLEDQVMLEPLKGQTSFTLPQGSYSPVDLCNYINTTLTELTPPNTAGGVYDVNPFLISQRLTGVIPQGYGAGLVGGVYSAGDVILGASKVEISYIDAQQKFAWDMFHTPMYDEDGTESVRISPANTVADARVQRQYSGIVWTHLGAERISNGETFDFWGGLLGFDVNSLYPTSTGLAISDGNVTPFFGVGNAGNATIVQATMNVNIQQPQTLTPPLQATGGFCGIDALVPKGKTFTTTNPSGKNFFLPISGDPDYFIPTNGVNTRIIAGNSVLGSTSQFGYFVIEVQGKFRNDVIGSGINKNNIVGIVGRFYELNSYTQGTEGDSIIYKHSGAPILVDSFKCRILDSTKNLADNIGNDNTIFLTISRGQKALMADMPEVVQQQLNKTNLKK